MQGMSGGLEAAGDMLTGGLIARAVEPKTGVGHGEAHGVCLNCGTGLTGDYCHKCGQPGHIHRSLAALWHDLLHGVLHFEGKTWKTLPMLAWRPGELTRRYIHGERARFVSPMALFLFSVFLMFAVMSAIGAHLEVPNANPRATAELTSEIAKAEAEVSRLQSARATAVAAGKPTTEIDGDLAGSRKALKVIMGARSVSEGGEFNLTDAQTGWASLDKAIEKANENPNLALYKIQNSAYKFSWALIPISVPFLWLMFAWRFQYKLYDHAIFVIYSLSFMTLLAVVLTVGGVWGLSSAIIGTVATFVPPIHMYRQLRGAYRLGRFNAALRTIALGTFSIIAATFFMLLLLALGVMG